MRTSTWSRGILCCVTLVLVAGCQTYPSTRGLSVSPIVPRENEQIVRDQLIIIVDVTGSMGSSSKFRYEKALAQAFVRAMPNGTYESGIDSFAGVPRNEWVKVPLAPFNRDVMEEGASKVKPLGSLTPLASAIRHQEAEMRGKGGSGALLVFSDGKVQHDPENVLQACRDLRALHGGELCIYTVQIGSSERGKKLLQDMARVNGCGKYYDGASLNSAGAIDALARDIFFGAREAPRPVEAPTPVEAPRAAPAPISWKINNILFDNDESVILPKYESLLDEAAAIVRDNPRVRLRLVGHTDSNASNEYNQKLSQRRVDAVKAALVKRGADPSRLETHAYGEDRPSVANDSPENLHTNRRVTLNVIE